MNYFTNLKKWMFDYTVQFNGGGRISRTFGAWRSLSYLSDDYFEFKPFTIMNAQVTRFFRFGSIYAGAENFTDFRQKHPVENFENPYNQGFDATNVWGPVMGRRIHIGLRFALKYN
jgi:hypothetical protein